MACTDKHRVFQIMVNLLSNARDAVTQNTLVDGEIRVQVSEQNGLAEIRIVDNGVGIATEALPKLFQHGFSTKKDGHGFGLHSSANSARMLGGNITACSPGPGRGATFQLTFPLGPSQTPEAVPLSSIRPGLQATGGDLPACGNPT